MENKIENSDEIRNSTMKIPWTFISFSLVWPLDCTLFAFSHTFIYLLDIYWRCVSELSHSFAFKNAHDGDK